MRSLDSSLCESAAGLLTEAFFENPAHVYICPDPLRRRAQLAWFLGGNLRMYVESDPSWTFCLVGDGCVDAMGFWTHSGWPQMSLGRKIRAGLLAAPFRLGLQGFRRLLETGSEIDRNRDRALGSRPFWYLNNMVVRDTLRGTGLGSRILTEQMQAAAATDPAAAFVLATQRAENVRFYQRLGFEVVSDEKIGQGPGAFRNWTMVHDPI